MTTKVSVETQEQANYVLAVDMTALWKRKTTGIQRVIREMMPHLAAAAAARSWDVVMVRKTEKGLEELVRCTGRYDEAKLMLAIESIARGQIQISTRLTAGIAQYVYQVMRAIGQLKVGKLQIRNAIRSIRLLVPSHIRSRIRSWRRKRSIIARLPMRTSVSPEGYYRRCRLRVLPRNAR